METHLIEASFRVDYRDGSPYLVMYCPNNDVQVDRYLGEPYSRLPFSIKIKYIDRLYPDLLKELTEEVQMKN